MPDLLAHALIAYAACTLLSWRYGWITPGYVTVGMAGAFVPDVSKVELVVPDAAIEGLLGLPFDFFALHTGGGALVSIAIGALLVVPRERARVAALLAVGAVTHLLADALLLTPTGRSYAILWPLARYHPPTPGLYLSTRPEPAVVAAFAALAVFAATRYRRARK